MNNLAVQVSPDNQKVLEAQDKVNNKAFNAAISNNQFTHGVAPAYDSWAATRQTQEFGGAVDYLFKTEEAKRAAAHLEQAGQNVHEIENGLYIDNKVLEAKLTAIEKEIKTLESYGWPEYLEGSWHNATSTHEAEVFGKSIENWSHTGEA
jgi:hypothetical protein